MREGGRGKNLVGSVIYSIVRKRVFFQETETHCQMTKPKWKPFKFWKTKKSRFWIFPDCGRPVVKCSLCSPRKVHIRHRHLQPQTVGAVPQSPPFHCEFHNWKPSKRSDCQRYLASSLLLPRMWWLKLKKTRLVWLRAVLRTVLNLQSRDWGCSGWFARF